MVREIQIVLIIRSAGIGRSIQPVVGCRNVYFAALDIHRIAFQPFIRLCHINFASGNDECRRRVNSVVSGRKLQGAAFDIDIAFSFRVILARMDRVILRRDIQLAFFDPDRVVCSNSFTRRGYIVRAIRNHKIILADNAVHIACRDIQCPAAVQCQITDRENNTVHRILHILRLDIFLCAVRQRIGRPGRKCQKYLIGIPDQNRGIFIRSNRGVVQYQLYFVRVRGIDNNLSFAECPRNDIGSRGCNRHNTVFNGSAFSCNIRGVSVQRYLHRGGFVVRGIQIAVRELVCQIQIFKLDKKSLRTLF